VAFQQGRNGTEAVPYRIRSRVTEPLRLLRRPYFSLLFSPLIAYPIPRISIASGHKTDIFIGFAPPWLKVSFWAF